MMSEDKYSGLTQLGAKAELPASPEEAVLERVPNPQKGERYIVRFTAPEFTSLCPITGQTTCRVTGWWRANR
jgi:7-cyano-7-deazaguanine reductase